MSIRLRTINGVRVALCAAETDEEPGDLYLDDGWHEALADKFARDWQGQRVDWIDERTLAIANAARVRVVHQTPTRLARAAARLEAAKTEALNVKGSPTATTADLYRAGNELYRARVEYLDAEAAARAV